MGRETNHAIHQIVPVSDVELEIIDLPKNAKVSFLNMEGTVCKGKTLRIRVPRLEQYGAVVITKN